MKISYIACIEVESRKVLDYNKEKVDSHLLDSIKNLQIFGNDDVEYENLSKDRRIAYISHSNEKVSFLYKLSSRKAISKDLKKIAFEVIGA